MVSDGELPVQGKAVRKDTNLGLRVSMYFDGHSLPKSTTAVFTQARSPKLEISLSENLDHT